MKIQHLTFSLLAALMLPCMAPAQTISNETLRSIGDFLTEVSHRDAAVSRINVDSVAIPADEDSVKLFCGENCAYIPFTEASVKEVYAKVRTLLPAELTNKRLGIFSMGHSIDEYVPLAWRSKSGGKVKTFTRPDAVQLVKNISSVYEPTQGLSGRHIVIWPSHGYYYEPKLTRWEWQRARLFQTVEDLYTRSYVMPFLVPMLENAGANVLIPRERDTQTEEVIVDNDKGIDSSAVYLETNGDNAWTQGNGNGFAHLRAFYKDFENPFNEGTYREVESAKRGNEATAEWKPNFKKEGKYAVYVSYRTEPNSTDDALYTVFHKGRKTQYHINQQMGGGTWIYLGTFAFNSGKSDADKVTLSNLSSHSGKIVTADAVKFGGGMGNIARHNAPSDTAHASYSYVPSGYPRFTEGARYWMQWAGVPDSVYSPSKGVNDYTDDYINRGIWVNYMAGGSSVLPDEKGLKIPVDISMAFHSDAGTTKDDRIIGTLGIYYSKNYDGKFYNGSSRFLSHDLCDLIQSNIVKDIRTEYAPEWNRRGMWNKPYYEAWEPRVPAMLLELLSHENFADMRYGLDPRFRFTVSRAIYKGMLQFISSQYGKSYVVQPLPVDHMAISFTNEKSNQIELNWKPVEDSLENSAKADKYIVYTRIADGDFDNGTLVSKNTYRTTIPSGVVCSFKVTAVNRGGESFPSEILSAGKSIYSKNKSSDKNTVLIVNGFDRISAPADFVAPAPADTALAGFIDEVDHGVPYVSDFSYIGKMKEYRREIPWTDDDSGGYGDSFGNYETMVIAGNTFDYPSVHGEAILKAGKSFNSCSNEAVDDGQVKLGDYAIVDMILGKQCQTKMGRGGFYPLQFKTFTDKMQAAVTDYCNNGGNIFVSGAYVGTDLWCNRLIAGKDADKKFATDVLHYKWRDSQAATRGDVKCVDSPAKMFAGNYKYYNELNPESYVVESPDGIEPADEKGCTIMRYSENDLSAGVAYKGKYKTVVMGFPFESVNTAKQREQLMQQVLDFLK